MSTPSETDFELTREDRLIAELVRLSHSLPGGQQVAIGLRLQQCAETAEQLFTAHQLPRRDQLIAELSFWKVHAEQGVKFLRNSEQVITALLEEVKPSGRPW